MSRAATIRVAVAVVAVALPRRSRAMVKRDITVLTRADAAGDRDCRSGYYSAAANLTTTPRLLPQHHAKDYVAPVAHPKLRPQCSSFLSTGYGRLWNNKMLLYYGTVL